jgi:hypothetical protein
MTRKNQSPGTCGQRAAAETKKTRLVSRAETLAHSGRRRISAPRKTKTPHGFPGPKAP